MGVIVSVYFVGQFRPAQTVAGGIPTDSRYVLKYVIVKT